MGVLAGEGFHHWPILSSLANDPDTLTSSTLLMSKFYIEHYLKLSVSNNIKKLIVAARVTLHISPTNPPPEDWTLNILEWTQGSVGASEGISFFRIGKAVRFLRLLRLLRLLKAHGPRRGGKGVERGERLPCMRKNQHWLGIAFALKCC